MKRIKSRKKEKDSFDDKRSNSRSTATTAVNNDHGLLEDDHESSTSYLPSNLMTFSVSNSSSSASSSSASSRTTLQSSWMSRKNAPSKESKGENVSTTWKRNGKTSNTSIHTNTSATIEVENVLELMEEDDFEINPDCDVDSSLDTSILSEQSEYSFTILEEEKENNDTNAICLVPQDDQDEDNTDPVDHNNKEEKEQEDADLTSITQEETFYKGILRTNNNNERKRSVTFADDNNLPITTQRTISVSPRKLVRRVRRDKGGENEIVPSAYKSMIMEESTPFIMGRVLVLLMDPPTKQYELTSVPYPLVSNENNHVGPTKLRDILKLVAGSASYEPLQLKTYQYFCRPEEGGPMDNDLTIVDYAFAKDEVLIGVPEDYTADQCQVFAKPILEDKRLLKLLRKLKKYEKRMERMKRFEKGLQVNMKHRTAEKDRMENRSFEIKANSQQLVAGIIAVVCLAMLVGGFIGMTHNKVPTPDFPINLLMKETGNARSCQRRGLFGCKKPRNEIKNHNLKVQMQIFRNGIKDISNWRLEGDDLML